MTVKTSMQNYFASITPTSKTGSCTSALGGSGVIQTCTLSPSSATGSSTYTVGSAYIGKKGILNTSYTLSTGTQAASMNKTSISTTVP